MSKNVSLYISIGLVVAQVVVVLLPVEATQKAELTAAIGTIKVLMGQYAYGVDAAGKKLSPECANDGNNQPK